MVNINSPIDPDLVSDFPTTKTSVQPDRILYHLSRSPLLLKYLREIIIQETLLAWLRSPEFALVRDRVHIGTKNPQTALLELYQQIEFRHLVRSRFLGQKSQLDRVLFSIIQVKNRQLAEELYCRVLSQEGTVTQLARQYSDSVAAKRGGTIGPISSLKLHPLIQQHLMGLQPKQLSPIFQLDEHYVFLQLDRELPVQLTPEIEQQLLNDIFEEWLQVQIRDRIGKVQLQKDNFQDRFLTSEYINSDNSLATIAQNIEAEANLLDTIEPTTSLFFPKISPTGEILPPNAVLAAKPERTINSSLFFNQEESPTRIISQTNRHRYRVFVKQIFAFFFLFGIFLAGEILAFNLLRELVTTTIVKHERL